LSYAYLPARTISSRQANIILCLFALASATLAAYIFHTTDSTSTILDSNMAPSAIKIGFAVCAGVLFAIAGLKILRSSKRSKDFTSLTIATAAFILIMSVVFSSTYRLANELQFFLSHLYKLAAYMLFFRALVINNIKQPFYNLLDLKYRLESTLNALPDLVFETSREGVIYQYHSNRGNGHLIANPQEFIGHNISEYLPAEATTSCTHALKETSELGSSYGQQYSLIQSGKEYRYEISASVRIDSKNQKHYLMIIRDVSTRYSLTQRLEALLQLAKDSEGLTTHSIAQRGLDALERLTKSKVSFLHILSHDERDIATSAWGSETEAYYCKAEQKLHNPIEGAEIWADCVRTRKAVVVNDYAKEQGQKGLTDGRYELKRFISVPIFDGERVSMVIGVGNAEYNYDDNSENTLESFGSELHQILQRRQAHNESEDNRLLLTSALENLPIGVAIIRQDKNSQCEYFNKQFPALFGMEPSLIKSFDSFWDVAIKDVDLRPLIKARMEEDFATNEDNQIVLERLPINPDGKKKRYLNIKITPIVNSNLRVILAEDMTDTMRNEEEISIAATAFSSHEGILIADANMRILRVNTAFERSSGYSAEELIGKSPAFLQSGNQPPEFYEQLRTQLNESGVWRGEILNKSKHGLPTPYSLTISAVKNALGFITHFVADYIDLSDIKSAVETISRLSYFDTLTELPNREKLKNIMSLEQLVLHPANEFIGALLIDLDNFKTINETLGHESGDLLLLEVTKRLLALGREGDHVARYGGDEFVILLMELGEDTEQASLRAQLIAQSVIDNLNDTYSLGSNTYLSTASIGATLFRPTHPNTEEVFKQLEIALSSAKRDGTNSISFFDPVLQETVRKKAQLLDELRSAIINKELELFYQPQLNASGVIKGAEGLIRWNHPNRGLLPPSEFLPLAAASDLMIDLGDEVLRMGLAQLNLWQKQNAFGHLQLSLNITADQFYEERFETALLTQLEELAITPGSLMLEFTEAMVLDRVDEAREKIARLNNAKVEFAMDDFGTGYSSLSYLSSLPMSQLKVDQSFVGNIGVHEADTQIVRAIINMAHILGLAVVAEGVETLAQLDYLKAQKCELFQGYLFSRPVPVAEFNQFVLDAISQGGQA
jgi:diguanylate cyclase (GGDEF)-like protein/PAS domain S-box-containing protein